MEQNIEIINGGGIVCDNPKCDWDFDNFMQVMNAIKIVNSMSEEDLKNFEPANLDSNDPVRVMVTTHKQVHFDIHKIPK